MKHNPMGINIGLCSLEKIRTPQKNSKLERHKKSCGHFSELLSVKPNILVVSWRQICDNLLTTKVWGTNIVYGK